MTEIINEIPNSNPPIELDDKKSKKEKKEQEKKEKKEQAKKEKVPFQIMSIFKDFGNSREYVLMAIGFIAAIGFGASLPLQTVLFGDAIDAFNNYSARDVLQPPLTKDQATKKVDEAVLQVVIYFAILAGAVFIFAYLLQALWCYTGASQSRKVRIKFFDSILKQPVAWHDEHKPGELTTHLVTSMSLIQDGISEKFVNVFNYYATFIGGFVIAFVKSWEMTLVLLAVFPVLAVVSAIFAKIISGSTDSSQKDYAEAGGVAQEVLSNIRTVNSYNAQKFYHGKFDVHLMRTLITGKSKAVKSGLALATVMGLVFLNYALGFWYLFN